MATLDPFLPPSESRARLGKIVETFASPNATRIPPPYPFKPGYGGKQLFRLSPERVFFFAGPLAVDTDGAILPGVIGIDSTHQARTSLSNADGSAIDANKVPYFVLPMAGKGHDFRFFLKDSYSMDIRLGDIAAVVYKNRVAYAIFADSGPVDKLGEGSIALHRALGIELIVNGRYIDSGIDDGVMTFVFPGSGTGKALPVAEITRIGQTHFKALGGHIA